MMELLEIMHFLEPLDRPGQPGVKMLTDQAIDTLALRGKISGVGPIVSGFDDVFEDLQANFGDVFQYDRVIPYAGNLPHHLEDPIQSWPRIWIQAPETENHVLMINGWAYLINQWVTTQRRGIGPVQAPLSRYVNEGSSLKRLMLSALGRFLQNGSWETNGRPYQAFTLRALQLLASYGTGKVKMAAENALDTLAAKYAFQSLHGKRTPPMRRNLENRGENGVYQNDYLAGLFGVLTGAVVFDTSPSCSDRLCAYFDNQAPGFALDAALMSYRVTRRFTT